MFCWIVLLAIGQMGHRGSFSIFNSPSPRIRQQTGPMVTSRRRHDTATTSPNMKIRHQAGSVVTLRRRHDSATSLNSKIRQHAGLMVTLRRRHDSATTSSNLPHQAGLMVTLRRRHDLAKNSPNPQIRLQARSVTAQRRRHQMETDPRLRQQRHAWTPTDSYERHHLMSRLSQSDGTGKMFYDDVSALKLAHNDSESISTAEQYAIVITSRHVTKSHAISTTDENRRTSHISLQEVHRPAKIPHLKYKIPNIVHFCWYGAPAFRFHHYISFLSVLKKLRPAKIYFWHDAQPSGPYWKLLHQNVTNLSKLLRMMPRERPSKIFGNRLNYIAHSSDIVRLEAILKFGGIYLDLDVIVLKSFDPLRVYDTVLGKERWNGLCNGIILAKPNAKFIKLWLYSYRYYSKRWDYNSIQFPLKLSRRLPGLLHIEESSLHRPNWMELQYLYGNKQYDWSKNYAIHLWFRFYRKEHDFGNIGQVNSTFGQIVRYILRS